MKNEKACLQCQHFGICTRSDKGRTIGKLVNEQAQKTLAKLYESQLGKEVYKNRKSKAELPFGHIKRNLNAGTFLLRGLKGVNAELSLLASCFNLRRLITLLKGVEPMVNRIKQLN